MNNKLLNGRSGLLIGTIAGLMLGGVSLSSQAQDCTTANWEGGIGGNAAQLAAGSPLDGHTRYGGPCSLEVFLDDGISYVADDSPIGEDKYNVRFYFNPNGSTTEAFTIFAANDADDGTGTDVIQLWYNEPNAGEASLLIATEGTDATITVDAGEIRANGWNSFEIAWLADGSAEIALSVNGGADQTVNVDTTSKRIRSALLGFVGSDGPIASTTPVYFDDFDSRRVSRPGRLCRGLTNDSRDSLDLEDAFAIYDEFASLGLSLAAGQPDHNEDGAVDLEDFFAVYDAFANLAADCSLHR